MDFKFSHWAVLAIALFASGSVLAAPVAYSETASTDLAGQSVGTLDVGVNTVQGRFCFSSPPSQVCPGGEGNSADLDSFTFALPGSLVVQNISFAWTITAQGFSDLDTQFMLQGAASSVSASENVDLDVSSTQSMFVSALPLTQADTYTIDHLGFVPAPNASASSASIVYTWTFVVGTAQVPEPATLGLLAIALAGLGFSRRERAR